MHTRLVAFAALALSALILGLPSAPVTPGAAAPTLPILAAPEAQDATPAPAAPASPWAPVQDDSPEAKCLLRLYVVTGDGAFAEGCGVWTDYGVYTAWHVVDGARAVRVVASDGSVRAAWGWWRLPEADAAVVRLEAPLPYPGLPLASEPLPPGFSKASGIAYYGLGVDEGRPCRTLGDATLLDRPAGDLGRRFYRFTGPSVLGMSGSPLLANGKVYGVLSHATMPPSGSYYAPCDRTSSGGFMPPRKGQPAPAPRPAKPDPLLPAEDCEQPGGT